MPSTTSSAPETSTQDKGLTATEVVERRDRDGRNELPLRASPGSIAIAARQLTDPVILVLIAAAVLTGVTGDPVNTAVIVAVIVLNTALGTWQEIRSSRAIAALSDLTAPTATVIRDGVTVSVDARDVVLGDRVVLTAGDIVAADGVLAAAESLELDESLLTGESVPVGRASGERVSGGTVITRGRGTLVVDAIGSQSQLGGIARSLDGIGSRPTPMQRQLSRLARRLALAAGIAALIVGVLSWTQGSDLVTSVVLAVSLAVAAIPESLPAVVSVAMARAGARIAAHGVLARSLASVEALGSISVLASDKTGTLTTGRMTVDHIWTTATSTRDDVLLAAVLCNDAARTATDGPSHDDPLEVALVGAAAAAGLDTAAVRARYARTSEEPFDAGRAWMSTTHDGPKGRFTVGKGSPETVLALPGLEAHADVAARARRLASSGDRVIALARRAEGGRWNLLGLVGLGDPARPDAARTISAFRAAGVVPIMITGDHPATARAVAAAVGIDAENVHARVHPDGKLAIIEDLRRAGEVVAMTGDGVNDAPALRAADIGVAMGQQGTEVAKQAAGIILRTDDLAAMIPAIVEGRRAYANVRRFLLYALAGGTAEVLIMLSGPLVGLAIPLLAAQILWINLLTHGLPGVAMGDDPAVPGTATAAPRPRDESILDRALALRIGALGLTVATASIVSALLVRHAEGPWQSTLFLTLLLAQLAVALGLQPHHPGVPANRWLYAAVALNVVLGFVAVTVPLLGDLLELTPLTPGQMLLSVPAAVLAFGMARASRTTPAALRPVDVELPSTRPGPPTRSGSE